MSPNNSIAQELQYTALAGYVALFASSCTVWLLLDVQAAVQWGIVANLAWSYAVSQAWLRRTHNRASASSPDYSTLGLGTQLTLLRGALIAAMAGFLVLHYEPRISTAVPALLYSVAAILDRVDGAVARKRNHTSQLGSELDTVFDAMGLLIVPLLAVLYGKLHFSYLLVSIAYYCFVAGLGWRSRHGLANYPLHPSLLRRSLAGFQMGFVAVALWPFINPVVAQIAGVAFMLPLLLGFMVDWCVVCGRLHPEHEKTAGYFKAVAWFGATWLQPALRIVVMLALISCYASSALHLTGSGAHGLINVLLAWISLFAGVCIVAGFCARSAALVLVVAMAAVMPTILPDANMLALICCTVWLMLLGSGHFTVWQGDDVWVNRQDGAP